MSGDNEDVGSDGGCMWDRVRAHIPKEANIYVPTNVR